MASMAAEAIGGMLGGDNMVMGQMFPNQSLSDTMEARQFRDLNQGISQQMQPMAQQDVQRLFSGMKQQGIFTGDMSNQQRDEIAQNITGFLPMMNMFAPGMADSLGPGFSSASFGGSLAMAGRSRLGIPGQAGTGIGMQAMQNRISGLTTGTLQNLQGMPGGERQALMGFGFGQTGDFVRQAMQQGLGPGGDIFSDDMQSATQNLTQFSQEVVKPMSAIRDLGGKFANMNAGQMFGAMDQITLGGSGRQSLEANANQIRMFKQATRMSGLSMQEGDVLQRMAGDRARELGGDFGESGTTAGQHAMFFGAAIGTGMNLAENRTTKMRLMQIDAMLTAQAGESMVADQMSALMRMGETGMLKEGTKAHEAFKKLKAGAYKYMDEGEFREMLADSGVPPQQAAVIRNQRAHNQLLYGDKVTPMAREQQWELDIGEHMRRTIANDLSTGARTKLNGVQALQLGTIATEAIRDTAGQKMDDVKKSIREKFIAAGVDEGEAGELAELAFAAGGTSADQLGFKSVGEAAIAGSPELLRKAREKQAEGQTKADEEARTSFKGQRNLLERGIDTITEGVKTAREAVGRALGGIPKEEEDAKDAKDAKAASREATKNTKGPAAGKQDGGEHGGKPSGEKGEGGDDDKGVMGDENNPVHVIVQNNVNVSDDDASTADGQGNGAAQAGQVSTGG